LKFENDMQGINGFQVALHNDESIDSRKKTASQDKQYQVFFGMKGGEEYSSEA
jgi:hypothetical protein